MYKILRADKDAYITDRVIDGTRTYAANVGSAGSLDLFKLYGNTTSASLPNTELSRLLIHFDLTTLRSMITAGSIDINHETFDCRLKLFDVYGGQPCPINFDVSVHPLSRSFDEGLGRDVAFYSDYDVCNFLTASRATNDLWSIAGANHGGAVTGSCDYIDTLDNVSTAATQHFTTGEENLYVDVTRVVSATLAGLLPDAGFRIALSTAIESDTRSYYVKRFASRHAYNEAKRPQLIVRFDDSVFDDSPTFEFDVDNTLYMRNYSRGVAKNLISASNYVTGSNCLLVRMSTPISGGTYSLTFTGSQVSNPMGFTTGTYVATINIPTTNPVISSLLNVSSSIDFTPVWVSLDGTHAYMTGSTISAAVQYRTSTVVRSDYIVSAMGVHNEHYSDENVLIEVNIFDQRTPYTMIMRVPAETPSVSLHDAYYGVRDVVSNAYIIPFDTDKRSTRLSSDGNDGMYFYLDTSSLPVGGQYTIDILIVTRGNRNIYKDCSPTFKVVNSL